MTSTAKTLQSPDGAAVSTPAGILNPAVTVVPRPRHFVPAHHQLRFFYGAMGMGKTTLALQNAFNLAQSGRKGVLLTSMDRAGAGTMSSRLGVSAEAVEVTAEMDLTVLIDELVPAGGYVILDEAQFVTPQQVDQLSWAVDELNVDVDCYGLATDFKSAAFPGSLRLFELADQIIALQVEVTCWCGRPGRQNARIENGVVARDGAQVAVGDTGSGHDVRYQVLCRRHWRLGALS
jgi:thymidine kinase